MKKRKSPGLFAAFVLLAAGLTAGCGQGEKEPVKEEAVKEEAEKEEGAFVKEETTKTEAKETAHDGQREITDMAGRTMTVPEEIETVFSSDPVSGIYLYTLAPDRLLGWNYELNEVEKSVILEEYHDLPSFGMGDSVNYEAVIAADPTIAFHVTTMDTAGAEEADQLSDKLGIPVVAVSRDLLDAPEVYRLMGTLFGMEEEAEALAVYAEDTFGGVAGLEIPEEEKVRIYYGNGEDSLETAPAGSSHGQLLELVNAVNVADLELGEGSRVQVSLEQLLAWDPDVIVVNGEPKADLSGGSAAEAILNDPNFASLKAVQAGKVYGTPNAPFGWVDRPQGPNRIVGMRWLSGLIYPEYLDFDVDEEVKEFFRLFYHVELTDEELEKIYSGQL